ncbi:MAG: 30S ribosomal protein S16 [Parcubacteria group bacterium]|nr:30S ribosomal protein S16 [Parcubacteria group bacterium]
MIRLQRFGKKNQPFFRVVLTDKRNSTKSGKFIEVLGWHNPETGKSEIKKERVETHLKTGAEASDAVHNLLVRTGIIKGKKRDVASKKNTGVVAKEGEVAPTPASAPVAAEAPTAEAPKA